MSFLMPSSPCRSLDPPSVGRDRAYRGEHLRGVVGSELEGLFNVLLRPRMGGRVFRKIMRYTFIFAEGSVAVNTTVIHDWSS